MWARALQRQERPGHGRPRILVPKGPRHSSWGRTVMIGWGGGQSCGLDHSPVPRGRSRSLGSRALKPNAEAAGARLGPRRSARVRGPLGQRPPSGAGPFGREAQLGEPPRLQRGTGKWGSRARVPKTTAEPTACTTPWGRAAASSRGRRPARVWGLRSGGRRRGDHPAGTPATPRVRPRPRAHVQDPRSSLGPAPGLGALTSASPAAGSAQARAPALSPAHCACQAGAAGTRSSRLGGDAGALGVWAWPRRWAWPRFRTWAPTARLSSGLP